jgi:hypothetical protein
VYKNHRKVSIKLNCTPGTLICHTPSVLCFAKLIEKSKSIQPHLYPLQSSRTKHHIPNTYQDWRVITEISASGHDDESMCTHGTIIHADFEIAEFFEHIERGEIINNPRRVLSQRHIFYRCPLLGFLSQVEEVPKRVEGGF